METAAVSGRDGDRASADDPAETTAALEDDWAAFSEFYRSEQPRLVRVALLLTGSLEIAQDVVQDSFVRVYRRWESIRDPAGYVYRVVVNGCRSHRRRADREQRLRDRVGPTSLAQSLATAAADELTDALAALPYRQRAALVLRFYDDLSEADTAEVLGCRPGTVGSLVHRGLAQLKKVIEL